MVVEPFINFWCQNETYVVWCPGYIPLCLSQSPSSTRSWRRWFAGRGKDKPAPAHTQVIAGKNEVILEFHQGENYLVVGIVECCEYCCYWLKQTDLLPCRLLSIVTIAIDHKCPCTQTATLISQRRRHPDCGQLLCSISPLFPGLHYCCWCLCMLFMSYSCCSCRYTHACRKFYMQLFNEHFSSYEHLWMIEKQISAGVNM